VGVPWKRDGSARVKRKKSSNTVQASLVRIKRLKGTGPCSHREKKDSSCKADVGGVNGMRPQRGESEETVSRKRGTADQPP